MIAPLALGHGGDNAAADANPLGDLTVREIATIKQPPNFHNQCGGEHRSFLIELEWSDHGKVGGRPVVNEGCLSGGFLVGPKISFFGEDLVVVVEEQRFPVLVIEFQEGLVIALVESWMQHRFNGVVDLVGAIESKNFLRGWFLRGVHHGSPQSETKDMKRFA
jgi:hypothetical protein